MQTNKHGITTIVTYFLMLIGFTLSICSCATTQAPNQKSPGFLDDYSILKPVANSPKDVQIYAYTAPDVEESDYHAIIVDPVTIYQTATESGVTESQVQQSQIEISNKIKEIAQSKLPLTNKPGRGVARVKVAITGAVLEGDGFKPRYLIPVSAIIQLTSIATGLDNKTPVLAIETKTTDSKTGKLLRATVATVRGDKFRQTVHTPQEFQAAAEKWVKVALKYVKSPAELEN